MISRLEAYLSETLEKARPAFGNMPACPFVHAERLKGKIRYEVGELVAGKPDKVWPIIEDFLGDSRHSSLIILDPSSMVSKDEGVNLGKDLCEKVRPNGFFAACIHPLDTFDVAGFRTREPVPFVSIMFQSRSLLNEGRQVLKNTAYYADWSPRSLEYISYQIGD